MNNGGVRVENILHEGAYSSTNYEAIWRSSFFNMKLYLQVSRFTTSGLDVRILLNENVSETIHFVIFELIYGFVRIYELEKKKNWKFLFSSFQKTAAPDSFTIE